MAVWIPRRDSVSGQFIRTLLLTVVSALVLLTLTASAVGYVYLREQMRRSVQELASLTAMQAQAAALFEDRLGAQELLDSIATEEVVTHARLETADGRVLARLDQPIEGIVATLAQRLAAGEITHEVTVDGKTTGWLTLRPSPKPLLGAMTGLVLMNTAVATLLGVLAMMLGARLSARVLAPLRQLSGMMRHVVDDADYTQRAPRMALAEVETLRVEFNELLNELMCRDQRIREANAALERIALSDSLTGLPNRAMFDRAWLALRQQADHQSLRAALIYIDVDNFKSINDRHGHEVGDQVLIAVAKRIQTWLPEGGLAARIGGDEFVALLSPLATDCTVDSLTTTLRWNCETELDLGGTLLVPRVSIGCAIYPDHVDRLPALTRRADDHMYSDKRDRQQRRLQA